MQTSVLVIDDSAVARRLILDTLREIRLFSTYHEAASGIEGFELLRREPIDVVLCDLEMPGIDGFGLLDLMKGREELRDIPVIMLTGEEAQDRKIEGLERGASDYVTKPFDPAELVARVKVQLKVKSLQDHLKQSNRLLEELANTDPLTGLCNRRCLMGVMEREIKRSERTDLPISLVMVDIDFFKRVNDTYGHQMGDEVLVAVSALLQKHLREYDQAARFGGEEFAVVLPATQLHHATQAAERMRAAAGTLTFEGELHDLRLTFSCGVATYPHPRVHSLDELIRTADDALYQAKREGRNRVVAITD